MSYLMRGGRGSLPSLSITFIYNSLRQISTSFDASFNSYFFNSNLGKENQAKYLS